MQNKYLNNDVRCELEAYTCISILKAIFSDFSNNNLQNLFTNLDANRIVNSNNFSGYKALKPLINRDLSDLVITDVRVQLMLPDSLIIADNPVNYGMTLEEVDSPLSGNSNININHMRVYLILMYSLAQNQNVINFNEFDRSVLTKKETKKLGNIKKFRKAIKEYKNISPFILARGFRNFFTKQKEDINAITEHRSLILDLEFFFRLAKYFHNKLLKLKYIRSFALSRIAYRLIAI